MGVLYLFLLVSSEEEHHGSGVFTMTFSSADVAYLSLCYIEWPSVAGSFLHSACLFHPYPYNFTINPGFPTKIGRPLRDMQSDHITVSINVTDSNGGYHDSILERFIVDGSLPGRTITTTTEFLTIEFAVTCDQDFFGLRCARFCKISDENYRHLACSETGEKICLPGWTGVNCTRVERHDGANRVLSRLVGARHAYHDAVTFIKHRSDKHTFLFSTGVFFTVFIGFALYVLNSRRTSDSRNAIALVTY